MNQIETIEYRSQTIEIWRDDDPWNPREWDNLGTMLCVHPRYKLGDKQGTEEEIEEITHSARYLYLPLYLYDHSGITMNTTGFSCPWDSGMVGIIYVEKKKVREEYGFLSDKTIKQVYQILRSEVETYDYYLTGQVYGYTTSVDDSCWGFYGDEGYKNAIEEAKNIIDYSIKADIKRHVKKRMAEIKHYVPVAYRDALQI